jgi:hypothetical protein
VGLHLTPLPDRLRQLSGGDEHDATGLDAALLGPLVESLHTALEALREITRGVFPAQLGRSGLPIALGTLLARAGTTRPSPRPPDAAWSSTSSTRTTTTSATPPARVCLSGTRGREEVSHTLAEGSLPPDGTTSLR